jgi:hypothetical protein
MNTLESSLPDGRLNGASPVPDSSKEKRREKRVTVRFSIAEYARLKQKAGVCSLARFLRRRAVGVVKP